MKKKAFTAPIPIDELRAAIKLDRLYEGASASMDAMPPEELSREMHYPGIYHHPKDVRATLYDALEWLERPRFRPRLVVVRKEPP